MSAVETPVRPDRPDTAGGPAARPRTQAGWRAAWHVARNDLRLMGRDRGTLFWSFVGPFLFTTFFGFVFKPSPATQTVLYLRNEDATAVVPRAFAVLLREQGVDVRLEPAPAGARAYELLVPAAAADSLAAGRLPRFKLRSANESATPREQTLRAQILRAEINVFLGLSPEDLRAELDEEAVRTRVHIEPALRMQTRQIRVAQAAGGFQHTVPAYLIMFLLMSLLTFGASVLIEERRNGQLRRTLVSSITPRQLLLGKFTSRFTWAWLQIAVLLGAGGLLYRIRFGAHPEALLAVVSAFALCATGLGLLFATLFKSGDKAGGVGSLVTMALAALGGCWWPLEIVPPWMRSIAFALPTGWAFDGLNRVMAMDAGIGQVAVHLAVLLGLAAVSLWLAIRRITRAV
jgi:ABC-type multidrug transport system permease subunit